MEWRWRVEGIAYLAVVERKVPGRLGSQFNCRLIGQPLVLGYMSASSAASKHFDFLILMIVAIRGPATVQTKHQQWLRIPRRKRTLIAER